MIAPLDQYKNWITSASSKLSRFNESYKQRIAGHEFGVVELYELPWLELGCNSH
jgi:hypothetical protein